MTTPQTTYSYAQLEGIWLQAAAGTKYATQQWAALMAAIAEAESSGNPSALNANDNGGTQSSFGLWQISTGTHAPPSPNWNNPVVNAQLAIGKLDSQGLGAWGTYDSGAYKAFISPNTTPDTSGAAALPGTSAAAAASSSAANAAQANCAWSVGWGGIPGTSWLADLFGGGGNLGSGEVCLFSKSQVRAFAGIGVAMLGGLVLLSGVSMLAASVGLGAGLLSAMPGAGAAAKVTGLAGVRYKTVRNP